MAEPRNIIIMRVAPVAPACFASRSLWLSYLVSAAESANGTNERNPVLVRDRNAAWAMNEQFNFCAECTAEQKHDMQAAKRCQPDHLQTMALVAANV